MGCCGQNVIKEIKSIRARLGWERGDGKEFLIKCYVIRDNDATGGEFKTMVTFVVGRIPKENTRREAGG